MEKLDDRSMPDGTPRKKLDIERISRLGWSPKIDLIEGIRKTIKDFKESNLIYKK